jgi:hypothetical protein
MQIQMGEGMELRCGEAAPGSTRHNAVRGKVGYGEKVSQKAPLRRCKKKELLSGKA